MALVLIQGGMAAKPKPSDVAREAERRLAAIGYNRVAVKFGGKAVSVETRNHALQIIFVENTIKALDEIPCDFRDDRYWPAMSAVGRGEPEFAGA